MPLTGQHLFENDDTAIARRDRARHGSWERVPRSLQEWWNDNAAMTAEAVFDWDEVKRAAKSGAGK
jgi:hypothetical protein